MRVIQNRYCVLLVEVFACVVTVTRAEMISSAVDIPVETNSSCAVGFTQNKNGICMGCDSGWVNSEFGTCYQFEDKALLWKEALDECRSNEALLATIHRADKLDALVRIRKSLDKHEKSYWVGARQITPGGREFALLNHVSVNPVLWDAGEPSHISPDVMLCVTISSSSQMHLGDRPCTGEGNALGYVCEKLQRPMQEEEVLSSSAGQISSDVDGEAIASQNNSTDPSTANSSTVIATESTTASQPTTTEPPTATSNAASMTQTTTSQHSSMESSTATPIGVLTVESTPSQLISPGPSTANFVGDLNSESSSQTESTAATSSGVLTTGSTDELQFESMGSSAATSTNSIEQATASSNSATESPVNEDNGTDQQPLTATMMKPELGDLEAKSVDSIEVTQSINTAANLSDLIDSVNLPSDNHLSSNTTESITSNAQSLTTEDADMTETTEAAIQTSATTTISLLQAHLIEAQLQEKLHLQYLGCYVDYEFMRDISAHLMESDAMTIGTCIDFCLQAGNAYAGLQQSKYCHCGDTYGTYGESLEQDCSSTCSGNVFQKCGGVMQNSVYETHIIGDISEEWQHII